VIFVDSNVAMYLIGELHPHKLDAQLALERIVGDGERMVTDVEVFQEILRRYRAVDRQDAIQPAFDVLTATVDDGSRSTWTTSTARAPSSSVGGSSRLVTHFTSR